MHKPAARRGLLARSAELQGASQRKALRPSPISEACGSGLATRTVHSSFAFDRPDLLRRAALLNY